MHQHQDALKFRSDMSIKGQVCIILVLSFWVLSCTSCSGHVEPVPRIPGVEASSIYTVTANRNEIPVGREISHDSVFHTAAFTMTGETEISIKVSGRIENYSIHPLSKNVTADAQDNRLVFTVSEPSNLLVKINDYEPLLIFATPLEESIPDPNDPNVLYFGPGVHDVGRLILRSNQTVYIAGGAKIMGTLEGSEVENVKIRGRGCLDGSVHTSWDDRIFGIYFERSKNITVEGIAIRNCYWWVTHFLLCENVDISHINLFSFYRNNGGLMVDGCSDYSASNSFILTNDDCICPHALNAAGNGEPLARNYSFKNMVLYNVLTGNGIRIGASFETERCMNWVFEDIDLLALNPRGAAIISDHSDWATMENLRFVNFNVERSSPKIINFFIDHTRYSCFTGYKNERGNMRRVVFANFNAPGGEVVLKGYDAEHTIEDVWFQNFVIGGKPLQSMEDIAINPFVQHVHFSDNIDELPVLAEEPAFVRAPEHPAELILDDQDDRTNFVGFDYLPCASAFQGDCYEATVPDGFSNFKSAIYEPLIEGEYEVHIHWGHHTDMATNAPWTVHHQDGYTTKYFDQNASPGWHMHGTYHLDGDSWVRLALPAYVHPTDGKVVADAVRFIKKSEL